MYNSLLKGSNYETKCLEIVTGIRDIDTLFNRKR
jgi:hypothetical protein